MLTGLEQREISSGALLELRRNSRRVRGVNARIAMSATRRNETEDGIRFSPNREIPQDPDAHLPLGA